MTSQQRRAILFVSQEYKCRKKVYWNQKISDWKWQNSGIKKTDLALWFVERLFDGESFEEEILNSNAKYIKSQKRNIPKKYKTSIVLLSYLIQTGILTIDDTDELLNQCIDNGDIKKMLPDYNVMHFSC